MEEENMLGRKLGIKLFHVTVDKDKPDEVIELGGGLTVKAEHILELM